jgi:small subunit ribosomal protein S16
MAVRIRLSRFGRLHRPYFRIVAIDKRCHREGKANEILGSYDPLLKDKNIQVDMERVQSWLERGALLSEGLSNLLKHHGYALPAKPAAPAKKAEKPAAKKPARAAGKKGEKQPWVAPSRRALRQHALKLKTERKAKLAAEAAAKAPAAEAKPAEGAAPAAPAKS